MRSRAARCFSASASSRRKEEEASRSIRASDSRPTASHCWKRTVSNRRVLSGTLGMCVKTFEKQSCSTPSRSRRLLRCRPRVTRRSCRFNAASRASDVCERSCASRVNSRFRSTNEHLGAHKSASSSAKSSMPRRPCSRSVQQAAAERAPTAIRPTRPAPHLNGSSSNAFVRPSRISSMPPPHAFAAR